MTFFNPAEFSQNYDHYYQLGYYARRYPRFNRATLAFILRQLAREDGHILDFGAGSGRYALPLLAHTRAEVTAFDISAAALAALHAHGGRFIDAGRLTLLQGSLDDLVAHMAVHRPVDMVLKMFGVLAHIHPRRERIRTLKAVAGMLAPGGRLIASVPNARCRFRQEQRQAARLWATGQAEPGDIVYRRRYDGQDIRLYYHLYATPDEFADELAEAGLEALEMRPESILPERSVVACGALGRLDRLLCTLLPLGQAYGFLAAARPRA